MRARIQERDLARRLRSEGYSYAEIRALVPVGKSTLTRWLRDVVLTAAQKERILAKMRNRGARGRQIGAWRNRERSKRRARLFMIGARREFPVRISDPLFVAGLALWWAEGTKGQRYFQFMNSDPKAIRTMVKWLTCCSGIPKQRIVARVYVHRTYADKGFEAFWRQVRGLQQSQFRSPVFKPTPHTVKKNPSYMGCCRLNVYSTELFWRLKGWHYELLRCLKIRLPASANEGR